MTVETFVGLTLNSWCHINLFFFGGIFFPIVLNIKQVPLKDLSELVAHRYVVHTASQAGSSYICNYI